MYIKEDFPLLPARKKRKRPVMDPDNKPWKNKPWSEEEWEKAIITKEKDDSNVPKS